VTTNEQRARHLAEQFRTQHDLGDGPIKDMFELVHSCAGVDVLSMEAAEAEHGLSMLDPSTGTVVVAVATTPHPMRQRSSIAHELGHILAGDLEGAALLSPGERSPEEIRADAFARHLLLPLAGARRRLAALEGRASVAHLSELVQEFEVSPSIAAIQLRTLGRIDAKTCAEWAGQSTSRLAAHFGWLSQYRGLAEDSAHPRAPQALMIRAVDGYHRGVLGIVEVATWYGQDRADLEAQLGPASPSQSSSNSPRRRACGSPRPSGWI
jgi:Zn-dependent peptidase ImmA (M78 family)